MTAQLQISQLINDVVASAESDPENAPAIYLGAADRFRAFGLGQIADEFAARARAHFRSEVRTTTDDFVELEEAHARAHAEVGHFDDLEIAARRGQVQGEISGGASGTTGGTTGSDSNTTITPPIAATTRIGGTAQVEFNPSQADIALGIQQSNTILLYQGDKSRAQTMTLDLAILKFPTQPGVAFSPRPYGIITYALDGLKQVVKVDVGRGTRLTLAANYVDVLVGLDPPGFGLPSGIMTLGGSMGFFAAPSIAPVTCTVYIDALTNINGGVSANEKTFLVPVRAVSLLPPQASDQNGTTELDFYGWIGPGGNRLYTLQYSNGTIGSPIPLTNDVYYITLKNQGNNPSNFRLPFLLAL